MVGDPTLGLVAEILFVILALGRLWMFIGALFIYTIFLFLFCLVWCGFTICTAIVGNANEVREKRTG